VGQSRASCSIAAVSEVDSIVLLEHISVLEHRGKNAPWTDGRGNGKHGHVRVTFSSARTQRYKIQYRDTKRSIQILLQEYF
jgi:hypothetical protein